MMKPEFVTFTGADNWTDVAGMKRLAGRYPVEWGILFSPTQQCIAPRYPGERKIYEICDEGLRLSAHLCGRYAREIVEHGRPRGFRPPPMRFKRIQVNHTEPDAYNIGAYAERYVARGIAQCRGDAFPEPDNCAWLFDRSGGKGLAPASWPPHPGGRLVGYAGGIGPDNVAEIIEQIGAEGRYWLDMESGVRTDDRFDLALCERVCREIWG
jgi:hypothetical protein